MPQTYLSTDPNAGDEAPKYLSTDPNAGLYEPFNLKTGQGAMAYSQAQAAKTPFPVRSAGELPPVQIPQKTGSFGNAMQRVVAERENEARAKTTPEGHRADTALASALGASIAPEFAPEMEGATFLPRLVNIGSRALMTGAGTAVGTGVGQAANFKNPIAGPQLRENLPNAAETAGFSGATELVPELARTAAPSIAESALGITKRLRGFGRTPGQALLDETSGVSPAAVGESARAKIAGLTRDLEQRVAGTGGTVSTDPAVSVIDQAQKKAIQQNAKETYDALHNLRLRLTTDLFTGDPLARDLSPTDALNLKRGVGSLERSWNPETRGALKGTVRRVYSGLDKQIDNAVPGTADINQKISSLIPVADRAESTARGTNLAQRLATRVARPTGALAGAILGAGLAKYEKRSPYGGAAVGLLAPEILSAPPVELGEARFLHGIAPLGEPAARIVGPTAAFELARKKQAK